MPRFLMNFPLLLYPIIIWFFNSSFCHIFCWFDLWVYSHSKLFWKVQIYLKILSRNDENDFCGAFPPHKKNSNFFISVFYRGINNIFDSFFDLGSGDSFSPNPRPCTAVVAISMFSLHYIRRLTSTTSTLRKSASACLRRSTQAKLSGSARILVRHPRSSSSHTVQLVDLQRKPERFSRFFQEMRTSRDDACMNI